MSEPLSAAVQQGAQRELQQISQQTSLQDFLDYWQEEGARYARQGDYAWMAAQLAASRVLEIGCGPGFGTAALFNAGKAVLALENIPECVAKAQIEAPGAQFLAADVCDLSVAAETEIAAFAPTAVVCWLMGAPATQTGAQAGDSGRAVVAYREKIHRAVAELAARLPSVQQLHFVDRTVIHWQAKETGRSVLARYHLEKTLAGLPFTTDVRQALYRKLSDGPRPGARHPMLPPGSVPVLASLLAERMAPQRTTPNNEAE